MVSISSFIENMFTPLPGDTVTVFGAYLAGLGRADPYLVFLAATVGGSMGFMGLYFIGSFFIHRSERRGGLLGIRLERIDRAGDYFRRWGYWLIVFNRFFYGIRFIVAIFAGVSRLDIGRTFIAAIVGTAIWNAIIIYLGYILGENWGAFKETLWKYNRIIIPAIIVAIGIYILLKYRFLKHRRSAS